MTWLVVRLILSLALVAGLLWLAARLAGKRGLGASAGAVEILARQPLSRTSSVCVVRVADRVLILGSSDQQVTLLGETDLVALETSTLAAQASRPAGSPLSLGTGAVSTGAVSTVVGGSVLDPAQWRAMIDGVRDRTVRRK